MSWVGLRDISLYKRNCESSGRVSLKQILRPVSLPATQVELSRDRDVNFPLSLVVTSLILTPTPRFWLALNNLFRGGGTKRERYKNIHRKLIGQGVQVINTQA